MRGALAWRWLVRVAGGFSTKQLIKGKRLAIIEQIVFDWTKRRIR